MTCFPFENLGGQDMLPGLGQGWEFLCRAQKAKRFLELGQ